MKSANVKFLVVFFSPVPFQCGDVGRCSVSGDQLLVFYNEVVNFTFVMLT